MLESKIFNNKVINKGYFLPTLNLAGSEQMALDDLLLEKAMTNIDFSLALRFYYWKEPCLSIGKNQKTIPKRWQELSSEKRIQIIRRPSGGNAVLHGGGITYSLIWLYPPRKKHQAYELASQWLIEGFSELGIPLKFGQQLSNPLEKNCFSTSTSADLVDLNGEKRIGSAQLWRKGNLLQHGEILLDPPNELWMDIFHTKAPKPAESSIPRKGLDKVLKKSCQTYWSKINWQEEIITKEELEQIASRKNKYVINAN